MAGLLIFVPSTVDAEDLAKSLTGAQVLSSDTGPLGLRKAIIHLDMMVPLSSIVAVQ